MEAATPSVPFIIAADVGGTHTRIGCFDLDGSLLSSAVGRGGSPEHNHDAASNASDALADALSGGRLDPADAVGLAAGVAAIKRAGSNQGDEPNEWVEEYFVIPSLDCPRLIVNDAVAAHRGALLGGPGVIVVAGTGSMILAITDGGVEIESGQFEHYAGGSRHLAAHAIQLILAGSSTPADDAFVTHVLDFWSVTTVAELRNAVLGLTPADRFEINRFYGQLAPLISAAASSPLADRSLRWLAERTALGVAVLAPLVGVDTVRVATAGSLATDPTFTDRLAAALAALPATPTRLAAPALDPLRGAALLAYEAAGVPSSASMIEMLRSTQVGGHPVGRFG